jgi:hypothetical protein
MPSRPMEYELVVYIYSVIRVEVGDTQVTFFYNSPASLYSMCAVNDRQLRSLSKTSLKATIDARLNITGRMFDVGKFIVKRAYGLRDIPKGISADTTTKAHIKYLKNLRLSCKGHISCKELC